jgi:hypothetical protein
MKSSGLLETDRAWVRAMRLSLWDIKLTCCLGEFCSLPKDKSGWAEEMQAPPYHGFITQSRRAP